MLLELLRQRAIVTLALALLPLTPPSGSAQDAPVSACVPHGELKAVRQPDPRPVYGILEAPDDESPQLAMHLGTLLQEISTVFEPPDSLPPLLSYSFSLQLHRDGRVTNAQPVEEYIPPSLAAAMIRAVDSVSRLGGIGPTFFEMKKDPLPLRMVFRLGGPKTEISVPFYELKFPAYFEYETDKPALGVPGNAAPRYPEVLRQNHIEGEVLVQFVVDTTGRADMRTFRLLGPSRVYREFVRAVFEAVPKMRFSPAERRGCKVKQLVQLPFAFKLRYE